QRGVAILVVLVTTAVIGAAAADFAYNPQLELEAAENSRDSLRAEYMARSGLQLGQLLTAVQGSLAGMLQALPAEFRDAIVITDYAGFLAKVFGGDKESREGLGALLGVDLAGVEGLGSPAGTSFDLNIASEEGKYVLNCGGGLESINTQNSQTQRNLYQLLYNLVRPTYYDKMFNVADRDGVIVTREELPAAIIDWSDVDQQRYNPLGGASGSEERYDKGRDRYEAHNSYFDTVEELLLVRGISEDFWAAFGEMFTVYRSSDCKLLASGVQPEAWPLIAAMIAASAADRNAVYDPNTAIVAQQVAGLLKTGLPTLKNVAGTLGLPPCKVDESQCKDGSTPTASGTAGTRTGTSTATTPATSGDAIETLSNLICSSSIAALPQMADTLASLTGGAAAPKPTVALRPIPMCKGKLAQFLREKPPSGKNPRRFYRIDATGTVQRSETKVTQVHIRGVWDSQSNNSNPLCTNHQVCFTGTWVYFRID
ncbi:MAG TPA: type II secretion system protein GspK, partial [Pseudomonadota bacterium]|nr:type II secretion system protein GspK [Pseudomonadota bacterium]